MNKKNKVILIDIERNAPKSFKYEEYKKNNFIKFSILENNNEIDLSEYTAEIFFKLSNGNTSSVTCDIVENLVHLPLYKIPFEKGKNITFEIVFKGKKQRVTTFKMYLV